MSKSSKRTEASRLATRRRFEDTAPPRHTSIIVRGPKKSAKRAAARHGVPTASCYEQGKDVQCYVPCTPSTSDRLDRWYGKGPKNRSTTRTWAAPGTLLYVGRCPAPSLSGTRRKRK